MNVIHVVSSLNIGGAERFVIDLCKEQKNEGHADVTILSMGNTDELLLSEVKKQKIGVNFARNVLKLKSYFKDVDVVHVHSAHCLFRVLIATLFSKVKVIYTHHNEYVATTLKWRLTCILAYLKLSKFVFVSKTAQEKYLHKYTFLTSKSCTILNGIFPLNAEKKPCKKLRVSHVGRFAALKAQHLLIEAVALLAPEVQQSLSISFYGTGDLMDKNSLLAERLLPNIEVNFKGVVLERNRIYENSDILVVTSETEGLSLAILEALASGTPTIVSNVGGNPELIKDGINGFLYPYGNIVILADKLQLLSENKDMYKYFRENSIETYETKFSMKKCALAYLCYYQ